jgi:hypothetical protein
MKKEDRINEIVRRLRDTSSLQERIHVMREEAYRNPDLVIDKFISEALPQASLLYDAYLNAAPKGRSNLRMSWYLEKRKKAVLAYYDENEADFSLVRREMVEEESLYKLTRKQESRDFKVKLVTKMLKYWLGYDPRRESLRKMIQKHS